MTAAGGAVPPVATLYADFTCAYSYVTEAALRRQAARHGVVVRCRALELYPSPAPLPAPERAADEVREMAPLAAGLGLALVAPPFRPRTRKAHEAARFAAERGVEEAMREAIYAAYWRDGRDIGRIDVLTGLIAPLGIDPEELKIALDIDLYHDAVLRDRATAEQLRIPGAPTLFVGTGPAARVLVGAQPAAALDEALARG